jgi:hypothetical protein
MLDNQYVIFRDLDRRCVARQLDSGECRHAVEAKRALIESGLNQGNPIVRDVLAGRTTFVAVYDSFSRGLRGVRRFLPRPHDAAHNERVRHLAQIVPNVAHFTRRSLLAIDNPLIGLFYGVVASLAVDLVASHALRDDADHAPMGSFAVFLAVAGGLMGFIAGALAMLKYRTRDPKVIHAREAAAYMDLNYGYYRAGDLAAWAEFIRVQGAAGQTALARPDDDR